MTDWAALTARAALASHRRVGWIYWDPGAIARYTDLGVGNDGLFLSFVEEGTVHYADAVAWRRSFGRGLGLFRLPACGRREQQQQRGQSPSRAWRHEWEPPGLQAGPGTCGL